MSVRGMAEYKDYNNFTKDLLDDVLTKLNGTHPNFQRVLCPDKPSKIIVLGSLGDKSKDYSEVAGEETRTLTSVKNNAMTIKFQTKRDKLSNLKITPTCSIFCRIQPTLEEQLEDLDSASEIPKEVELAKVYKRMKCKFDEITLTSSDSKQYFDLDFSSIITEIIEEEETCSGGKISKELLENDESLRNYFKNKSRRLPKFKWKAKIAYESMKFNNNTLIQISLINDTEEDNSYETFLFDCNLSIEIKKEQLTPFIYDYTYEGKNYELRNNLRCINCHASLTEDIIETRHFEVFSQPRITPITKLESFEARFDVLCDKDKCIPQLSKLLLEMKEYITNFKQGFIGNDTNYSEYSEYYEDLIKRFENGVKILNENDKAMKAFLLMNKTFEKCIEDYSSWRLFQIVFIVNLIRDIIETDYGKDVCEVLHVQTGSGKSETYFGLVLFSAFWDRLNGKKFGTTAIAKFPLRMLSVQQLQRIANLMVWAEEIRLEHKIDGDSFTVSYFVGTSDDFPRNTHKFIERIEKEKKEDRKIEGKFIEICPICKGNVFLDYDSDERYIYHKCGTCDREFKLFFTQEEIYRFIPTIIVSTVDKFAGIALNRRTKNIIGGKLDKCIKHGFVPKGDKCEVISDKGECQNPKEEVELTFDSSPTLIIQDEMHLIREGFGTIDSHFETLIEKMSEEFTGKKFKNIAMTATIRGASEQIKHLYHKKSSIFPKSPPGGRGTNDFFLRIEKDEQEDSAIQRYLVGLKPNLRDNQFASLLTTKYVSEFIANIEENIDDYRKNLEITEEQLKDIIINYKNILTYHGKKSDVHSMRYYLDTVVNSKLDNYLIIPNILTGDSDLTDIKSLIEKITTYHSQDNHYNEILGTFATSVVSHGVDINRWNIMIFQGIPRNTAEYIQALSRVGRRYIGISFVWFYPNRNRDLSFYKNFLDYHKILEHKVEEVPISRWAKLGFKQTFTSIFSASILNYFSNFEECPIYTLEHVNNMFKDIDKRKQLINFIKKAYVSDSSMKGAEFFDLSISEETENRLNYLETYTGGEISFFPNALADSEEIYYRTQYGMRGIQEEVVIKPKDDDIEFIIKEDER